MLNVYEQVDRNRHRASLILLFFFIFNIVFFWFLGHLLGASVLFILLAIVFSIFSSLGAYFWGDKVVLLANRAQPASKEQWPQLYRAADNLAIVAQIPRPHLYFIESAALNAFATGRDPRHASICVTRGLLENLNQSQLEAVLGHEIGHIVNYDIRLMTLVGILVGSVILLSDWFWRGNLMLDGDSDEEGKPAFRLLVALIFFILAPLVAKLIQLAISRRREYLADAMAVKFTRQPGALISALQIIAKKGSHLAVNPALAHFYFANPLSQHHGFGNWLQNLFSTHPPIEKRIANLQKML